MPDSKSTVHVSARVRPDDLERLREAAEQQQTTVSAVIAALVARVPRGDLPRTVA